MRILLSPAKKMKENQEDYSVSGTPVFLSQTKEILDCLKEKSKEELQRIWKCNDKITRENMERISQMDLRKNLTPAILSYEGIVYQYMAPAVLEKKEMEYLESHLRILSGFYGVLKPMDGVRPYRLEMQAKLNVGGMKNLYEFWGESLYQEARGEDGIFINLASKEYSKCVESYLTEADKMIQVVFCEESKGRLVTKGTYAKMARGEMVRFLAENQAKEVNQIKEFTALGYSFRRDLSTETEYIFERKKEA